MTGETAESMYDLETEQMIGWLLRHDPSGNLVTQVTQHRQWNIATCSECPSILSHEIALQTVEDVLLRGGACSDEVEPQLGGRVEDRFTPNAFERAAVLAGAECLCLIIDHAAQTLYLSN